MIVTESFIGVYVSAVAADGVESVELKAPSSLGREPQEEARHSAEIRADGE